MLIFTEEKKKNKKYFITTFITEKYINIDQTLIILKHKTAI